MKNLSLFLFFLSLSFGLFAYTPKAEIDPENQKWNWTSIYTSTEKDIQFYRFTDLTKRELLSTGRYIFPIETQSARGKVRVWYLADCNTMKTFALGVFAPASLYRWEAGLAVFDDPRLEKDDAISNIVTKMMCGITTSENKKVFGIVNMNDLFLGWYPDEVLKVSAEENNYEIISINYNIMTGFVDSQWLKQKALVNCSEQSIEIIESKQKFSTSNLGDRYLYFTNLIESICEYGKNGLLPNGNIGPTIKIKHMKQDNQSQNNNKDNINKNEPNKSLKSISEAKDKCKTLGFKTGTEKFGACVLELTR